MPDSFFVTGGTGLLGNNLVRQLLESGHRVDVLLRGRSSDPALDGLPVNIVQGDLSDAKILEAAIAQVDIVIHAAGDLHIGWRDWRRVRAVNVEGTHRVARAARISGRRFVHVSTVDTLAASGDGRPIDEQSPVQCKVPCTYCVSKREGELEVHKQIQCGLDAVIVQPGFMLGPYDWKPSSGRMLLAVAKGFALAAPTGGMSGCDARDVASGALAAAVRGKTGRSYILAGENMTYLQAWRVFAKITKTRSPRIRMGPLVRGIVGYGGDVVGRLTKKEPDVNSAMIRMSSLLNYYSSGRAEQELGYRTRPFEQTVSEAWDWLKTRRQCTNA